MLICVKPAFVASAVAAALTLGLAATATAGWVPGAAVPISAAENAITLRVAAGADGTAAAVWSDGTTVRAAVKPSGSGVFEAPAVIGTGEDPDVAVSRTGAVFAAWTSGSGGFRASERVAGAASFVDLGLSNNDVGAQNAQAAFFADGRLAIKLERTGGITVLSRQAGGGPFESLGVVGSFAGVVTGSDLAVSEESAEIVVAATVDEGSSTYVRTMAFQASGGGSSSAGFDLLTDASSMFSSTSHLHTEPRVVAGPRRVITYISNTTQATFGIPTSTTTTLRSDVSQITGPPVAGTIDTTSYGSLFGPVLKNPSLVERSDGSATVAWLESSPIGGAVLRSADLPVAATTFGAKDDIEGYGAGAVAVGAPDLSPLPGAALAVIASDGGAVRTGLSSIGQPFGAPLDLVAGADQPASTLLAGDAVGGLVAAWTQGEGAGRRAYARLYDDTVPTLSSAAMPASLDAGQAGLFTAATTDAWSGAVAEWDFGDGQKASGPQVAHSYADGGLYAVSVRARDGAGNLSERIERVVRVAARPPGPASATTADKTAPVITALSLLRKRFAVAAAKRPAAVKRGTTVRFRLSEEARVTMTFTQTARGFRVGRSCSLRKPARTKTPARCTLQRRAGSVGIDGRPGSNSVSFKGRIAGRSLPRGSYRLSLVAADPAGNRSKTVATTFAIVRAR